MGLITGMAVTITDVLNIWNDIGVFSYVIPFLLIFAVVFAILEKTKILGKDNRAILAIVSAAVGLLALQFDMVSIFFANIFPKFGVGLAVFLVLVILLGFFHVGSNGEPGGEIKWIGWVVGIGVVIWALSSWDNWYSAGGFGYWFGEYFWSLIILGAIVGAIIAISKGEKATAKPKKGAE